MTYITIYHPEWLWISSAPSFLPTIQLYVLSCCSRCNAFSCFPPCGWIMIINGAVGGVCRVLFIKTLVIFICCPWLDPPFTPGLWWPDGFLHEIQISVGSNTGSRVMFLSNYNDVCVWPLITVQPSAYGSSDDRWCWTPHTVWRIRSGPRTLHSEYVNDKWMRIHVGFIHFWWKFIQFFNKSFDWMANVQWLTKSN